MNFDKWKNESAYDPDTPINIPIDVQQQASTWWVITAVLDEVAPGWQGKEATNISSAVAAINQLAAKAKHHDAVFGDDEYLES